MQSTSDTNASFLFHKSFPTYILVRFRHDPPLRDPASGELRNLKSGGMSWRIVRHLATPRNYKLHEHAPCALAFRSNECSTSETSQERPDKGDIKSKGERPGSLHKQWRGSGRYGIACLLERSGGLMEGIRRCRGVSHQNSHSRTKTAGDVISHLYSARLHFFVASENGFLAVWIEVIDSEHFNLYIQRELHLMAAVVHLRQMHKNGLEGCTNTGWLYTPVTPNQARTYTFDIYCSWCIGTVPQSFDWLKITLGPAKFGGGGTKERASLGFVRVSEVSQRMRRRELLSVTNGQIRPHGVRVRLWG
ncbi:hypothetical protein EVAR_24498_1 [Eumeta japonica]|uniref:Uncharacterized protein n=1 Tax=Eumeta variegata TaxID=151549 RepID=A0A4C1UQS3_EUMVA|nr:hypothetical protein EVAR_24498_1 [Eumeta japonica]